MDLAHWYPLIKAAHVGLVFSSVGLFAGRGLGVLLGATMPMSLPVRRLSQIIDTALLAAALLLLTVLHLNPFSSPWLLAKLALLLAYIVLGSCALKRARTRPGKTSAFFAALLCFAMMVAIARTHDPMGWQRIVGG